MAQKEAAYSVGEEVANAISHGLGVAAAIVGLTLLMVEASRVLDALSITGLALYGGSLVLLFLCSTLYHAFTHQKTKAIFKVLDHCAIYLLIAGTYTPFMLITLDGALATGMLITVWGLALVGILFKALFIHRFELVSVVTYLAMGWLSLVVIYQLAQQLELGGFLLLLIGGLVYSLGVIFYVWNRIPYNHAIWHLFVLGGAVCHFLAIFIYVVPPVPLV
ncbi:PAQR family membrane homeostasis protein TrhA [Aestuariirhabdus litorea]|uniref:Hemolysin III family protein n=1 Tax=Aestuariirhabdus litorea TaxID=2528527 RepID=A0A3P3VJY9_9GAMM|nr:hemolysin III family protein [Aestuariirhabdus litorea]RRJ83032.1 hemolysin III family protein [Aestuariirhabdus litorea]RWW93190.1 hemolysin III family protein [Endozoicomonadaceae bacterium GTF-13]